MEKRNAESCFTILSHPKAGPAKSREKSALTFYGKPELLPLAQSSISKASSLSMPRSKATKSHRFEAMLQTLKSTTRAKRSFTLWRIFATQDHAFSFLNRLGSATPAPFELSHRASYIYQSPRILSFERSVLDPGKRSFLVTRLPEFWAEYVSLPASKRHFYELIAEGSPCRMYLDLEYLIEYNQKADCDAMLAILRALLSYHIRTSFEETTVIAQFIELDSTTATKASRHLILHLEGGWLFPSNKSAGDCLIGLCSKLEHLLRRCFEGQDLDTEMIKDQLFPGLDETLSASDLLSLFVSNERNERVLFIDQGVYTKNRNFRLVYSSKIGKNTPLLPYPLQEGVYLSKLDYPFFLDTLICPLISAGDHLHPCPPVPLLTMSLADPTRSTRTTRGPSIISLHRNTGIQSYISPFPQVDQAVLRYVQERGSTRANHSTVRIKSATHFPLTRTLVYEIIGSRFCHNIGREHKSNGVYYIAELDKGTFHQRCYDPDCKHFRSVDQVSGSVEPNVVSACLGSESVHNSNDVERFDMEISDIALLEFAESFEAGSL